MLVAERIAARRSAVASQAARAAGSAEPLMEVGDSNIRSYQVGLGELYDDWASPQHSAGKVFGSSSWPASMR